jgi:hypothetical protein
MSRRHLTIGLAAITVVTVGLLSVPVARAQQLRLTLAPATITFADADPDTIFSIIAPTVTVSYRVRNNPAGNWIITLLASADLTSGTATIAITNITWTALPAPPFQNGTLSRTVAQTLASGSGNVQDTTTGAVVFRLANSWTYNVGIYNTSVVFTLTAP